MLIQRRVDVSLSQELSHQSVVLRAHYQHGIRRRQIGFNYQSGRYIGLEDKVSEDGCYSP